MSRRPQWERCSSEVSRSVRKRSKSGSVAALLFAEKKITLMEAALLFLLHAIVTIGTVIFLL